MLSSINCGIKLVLLLKVYFVHFASDLALKLTAKNAFAVKLH